MSIVGNLGDTPFGYNNLAYSVAGGNASNYAMSALNAGWAFRHVAKDTRDIYGIKVWWGGVSTPGTVQFTVEPVSAGVASGTPYDANATLSFTPTTGLQTLTFASHPTTGLVAGNLYDFILLTTVAGTTQTLVGSVAAANYPAEFMTCTNGTTRSNFTRVSAYTPIATIIYSDGSEEPGVLCPYYTNGTGMLTIYGNRATGVKLVLNGSVELRGAWVASLGITGTPTANLNFQVWSASGTSLASVSIPASQIWAGPFKALFAAPVTLTAGTYYCLFDQGSSGTSGNYYSVGSAKPLDTTVLPTGFLVGTSTSITSTPPTFASANETPIMGLLLNDIPAPSGGSGYIPIVLQ